jgi:hypothetical protein
MDRLAGVVAPLARVTVPEVVGLDRIPDRGALFVGNHTIFGFLDLPFLVTRRRRYPRLPAGLRADEAPRRGAAAAAGRRPRRR